MVRVRVRQFLCNRRKKLHCSIDCRDWVLVGVEWNFAQNEYEYRMCNKFDIHVSHTRNFNAMNMHLQYQIHTLTHAHCTFELMQRDASFSRSLSHFPSLCMRSNATIRIFINILLLVLFDCFILNEHAMRLYHTTMVCTVCVYI